MEHEAILEHLESLSQKELSERWKALKTKMDFQQEMFLFILNYY